MKLVINRKALSVSVVLAMTLAGCGGGTGDTATTSAEAGNASTSAAAAAESSTTLPLTTTTTVDQTTSTAAASEASIEDIPPECLAVMSEILKTFEPAVKDIDWDTATIEDYLQVMTALAGASIGDTSGCDDSELSEFSMTDEEGSALFLEVAEQEAPGAVGYFAAILAINEALGDRQSTGECAADIALFEEVVAGGVPWVDLPLPEQFLTLNLMSSIGFCSLQTQGELRSRPEVEEFLAGSPFAGG